MDEAGVVVVCGEDGGGAVEDEGEDRSISPYHLIPVVVVTVQDFVQTVRIVSMRLVNKEHLGYIARMIVSLIPANPSTEAHQFTMVMITCI